MQPGGAGSAGGAAVRASVLPLAASLTNCWCEVWKASRRCAIAGKSTRRCPVSRAGSPGSPHSRSVSLRKHLLQRRRLIQSIQQGINPSKTRYKTTSTRCRRLLRPNGFPGPAGAASTPNVGLRRATVKPRSSSSMGPSFLRELYATADVEDTASSNISNGMTTFFRGLPTPASKRSGTINGCAPIVL